jgi:DNA-binding GntR family transcriptional regulator
MARGKISKYDRIEQDIIEAIRHGDLKPGDKVDSESALKKKYNVSAITVRKAFTDLINDGYLVGIQGAGTFVAKKQMIRGLTSISFSEELRDQGYKVDMRIDSIEEVQNDFTAEKLGIDPQDTQVCVRRVRLANNEPVAYHISWFSAKILSADQAMGIKKTRSLYDTLKKCGIYPTWVNENYSVKEIIDANIYKQLNVKKGYPSFFVRRTTFDAMNNIIEYAETYFNKEWYSVTVNIKAE